MEIVRYINGVTVSEKELSRVKTVTREMTEAVNKARGRVQNGVLSVTNEAKTDG